MTSEASFNIYRSRKRALLDKVAPAVNELWDYIDENGLDVEDALTVYLPLIADRYGKAAAVMAADYFDECRLAANVLGCYAAITATGALWKVERDVKYALGEDFAYSNVRDFLISSVTSCVEDYGRQTIMDNSERDSSCGGYVSIPGANPCAFCVIKAINAWAYYNYNGEKLETEINSDAWHDNCTCTLQPLWDDAPTFVEDRMGEFQQMYEAGREAAYETLDLDPTGALSLEQVTMGMRIANENINH